jgi:hypothetical protein
MRKFLTLALILCLVLSLGACTFHPWQVQRTVRGSGNVIERVIDFDEPIFEQPGEGGHWNMFSLAILNVNFRSNANARIIIDEALGNSIVVRTDDNIMAELFLNAREENDGFGDGLTISAPQNTRFSPTEFTITTGLPVTHMQIDGAWNITYNHTATPYAMINIRGAANGDFTFGELSDVLSVQIDGAATLDLRGSVQNAEFHINGAGTINAFDLTAESATINVNGAGNANITATETLDAIINGMGTITYDGDPTITRQVNGIGRVRAR